MSKEWKRTIVTIAILFVACLFAFARWWFDWY